MPAVPPGNGFRELSLYSFERLKHVQMENPRAADVDYFVSSVDPNGVAVGTALTLLARAQSGKPVRFGRLPTVTATDASGGGGGLSVTVRILGYRFGVPTAENITVTCTDGNATTVTGAIMIDQILSATLVAKSGAGAGDALTVGIDGTSLGLPFRINAVGQVKYIINVANGTEADPLTVSSSNVDVGNSALKGLTVAATDNYQVLVAAGPDGDGFEGVGYLSGV